MPLVQNKNAMNPVVTIGIILFGLIGGYIYYSQIASKNSVQAFTPPTADNLTKFKDLGLNFTVLDDPKFRALQIYGESPVQPGETGRVDIFTIQ